MSTRKDKIKSGLDNELYSKIDELNNLTDDTLSSTASLADILDGYETKVDNMSITKPLDELQILDEKDVEIEIDDEDILTDYNNQVHGVGLNTLDDLLNSPTPSYTEELARLDDIETEDFVNDFDKDDSEKTQEVFTQNLTSPQSIDNFAIDESDTIVQEKVSDEKPKREAQKKEKTKKVKNKPQSKQNVKSEQSSFQIKNHIVDIILIIILIVLVYFLATYSLGA